MRSSAGNVSDEDCPVSSFDSMEASMKRRRSEFIEQNARSYDLFKRLIGFQHTIHKAVADKHTAKPEGLPRNTPITDKNRAEIAVFSILDQNKQYLLSASRALTWRFLHASGSLARPVFESIPKSFYIMAHPQTAGKFMLLEVYLKWKSDHASLNATSFGAFLEDRQTKETLERVGITAEELGRFRKKHTAKFIRAEIYDGETLKFQDQLYAALSSSSHPSVFRSAERASDKMLSKFIEIINHLSFLNLFLTINSQNTLLDDRTRSESEKFMRAVLKDVDPQHKFSGMYPSKDEYRGNLAITIESLS